MIINIMKKYFVYLLESTNHLTYVGATVDLNKRLRQHNGEIKGGAKATTMKVKKGEKWRRVCYIEGFPNWSECLKFEWAWKFYSRKLSMKLFPLERRKLVNLLKKLKVPKLILSGDRHSGGIYKHEKFDIYEVTASSFNQNILNSIEIDPLRIGKFINENNFGLLEIDNNSLLISIVSAKKGYKKEYSKVKINFN